MYWVVILISVTLALASMSSASSDYVNSDGQNFFALARSIDGDFNLQETAWSPDSTRLALKDDGAIKIVDVTGKAAPKTLTPDTNSGASPMAWSPDGEDIAFLRVNPNDAAGYSFDYVLINIQSLHEKILCEYRGRRGPRFSSVQIDDSKTVWILYSLYSVENKSFVEYVYVQRIEPNGACETHELKLPSALIAGRGIFYALKLVKHGNRMFVFGVTSKPGTSTSPQFETDSKNKLYLTYTENLYLFAVDAITGKELFPNFRITEDEPFGPTRSYAELYPFPQQDKVLLRLGSGHIDFPELREVLEFDWSRDRIFEIFDTETGKRLSAFAGERDAGPEAGSIINAALLNNGQYILAHWAKKNGRGVSVYDLQKKSYIQRLTVSSATLESVSVSPDSQTFVTNYIAYDAFGRREAKLLVFNQVREEE